MQHYRLEGTANVILRHRGALAQGQFLAFLNAEGRQLLILACRSRQVRGRKVLELFLNAVKPDGSWGEELSGEVSEYALREGLELRFRSWRAEVFVGGNLQFACNPSATFGPGVDPALATQLQTNCAGGAITLQTGAGLETGAGLATSLSIAQHQGAEITLLLLNGGDPEQLRATFLPLAYRFRDVVIVAPAAEQRVVSPESLRADQAINAALAQVTTPYVAILSGDWSARGLAHPLAQFLEARVPVSIMPLRFSATSRAGEYWGLLLPSRIADRPTTAVRNGVMVVDSELLGVAYWQVSQLDEASEGLRSLQRSNIVLSQELDADGQLGVPCRRQIPQAYAHIPGHQPGAQAYSGLRIDGQPLWGVLSPRAILTRLCLAAEEGCGSVFMLWDPEVGTAQRTAAWLRLGMLADIGAIQDAEGRYCGLLLSRDALVPMALMDFDTLDHLAFNAPHDDLAGAMAAFVDLARRLEIVVMHSRLEELDAQPQGFAAERLDWLPSGEFAASRLARRLPQGRLPETVTIVRAETADFDVLALQAISHGMIWDLCQYAIAADLVVPDDGLIPRLVDLFKTSGWAREPQFLATFMEALIARNYHNEIRPLLPLLIVAEPAPEEGIAPDLWLRHKVLDVLMRCRTPGDDYYLDADNMRLPPAAGVALNKGMVAYFLDSLSFYLALRGNWAAIVEMVKGTELPESMAHGFYERWLRAHIEVGALSGLEAEIAKLLASGRISAWSAHRLSLRLAQASEDAEAAAANLQTLLQGEDDMRALLQPPSKFQRLGLVSLAPAEPAAGVALDPAAVPGSVLARAAAPALALPPPPPAPITVGADEIVCIIVARNEFSRLKWLHSYYQQLGVDRFFLVDNLSDDETIDYFVRQPDVTILQTSENYRDSRYGVKWHNEIADAYLEGRWVLTVDADEAMVFAGCEAPGSLRDLCARLDAEGSEGFFAPLIDMYSAERLDQTPYVPGESLIERFPMFDGHGYHFDPTPGTPGTTVSGGVRIRLFWNNRHDHEVPHLAMQKVPLVRWRKGFCYLASTHDMTPLKVSAETGAILHYKFMPDFHQRAMEEVRRNQHYEGAREYRIYAEFLKDPANRSFVYEGSVRYEGPETLAKLGLIMPPEAGRLSTKASAAWVAAKRKRKPVVVPEVGPDTGPEAAVVQVVAEGSARDLAPLPPSLTLRVAPLPLGAVPGAVPTAAVPNRTAPVGGLPPAAALSEK